MSVRLYTIIKAASALALMAAATPVATATRDDVSFFAEAREAYHDGERVRLAHLAETLRGTEYAPWVEHWRLRLRLEEDSDDGVREFLAREEGSYLADKLRAEWLRYLGTRANWKTFQQEYPSLVQPDQELGCYSLQARLERRQDPTALDDARALWFSALDLAEACQPLVDRLRAEGRLTTDDVWARVRWLVEMRRFTAAKEAAKLLPARDSIDMRKFDAATDNPSRYLSRQRESDLATRAGRELALYATVRLSRNDAKLAASRWRGIEKRYTKGDSAYVWGQIAWRAALDHLPEALGWYAQADDVPLSEDQQAWWARAALRAKDWATLDRVVARMPPGLASQPAWLYWRGRARAMLGNDAQARALFERVAGRPNFYGHLADEELGRPITVPSRAAPPTDEEIETAAANPGLRRPLAVLGADLGPEMRVEAVREWSWYLNGLNDRQLLAAAEFARRQGAVDRAIAAAERTRDEHDFSLRYPAPFRDDVSPKAREAGLDDAWVYGLMRQESRFVTGAHSAVGAKGLMQLMPTTARWVARKIGYSDYHPSRMTETEINVTLGTSYLRMILDKLENQPLLASAAYNAGPRRARNWIGEQALEGAIYAETIPYNETRDYVKKVMSNAVIYAVLFDEQPQSLKARLGVIRPEAEADVGDLP